MTMQTTEERERRTHHGHAVARLRKSQGMKQSTLGELLGVDQSSISLYEQKEVLEDELLDRIAAALSVSPELIRNLEEDPLTIIFENNVENNTFENNDKVTNNTGNYSAEDNSTNTFNPLDKIAELFERLLESEKEKIALLEKLLKDKDK